MWIPEPTGVTVAVEFSDDIGRPIFDKKYNGSTLKDIGSSTMRRSINQFKASL